MQNLCRGQNQKALGNSETFRTLLVDMIRDIGKDCCEVGIDRMGVLERLAVNARLLLNLFSFLRIIKVHLTPKFFFRSIESTRYSKHLGANIF